MHSLKDELKTKRLIKNVEGKLRKDVKKHFTQSGSVLKSTDRMVENRISAWELDRHGRGSDLQGCKGN